MSFAPSGLHLLTASKKGDVQYVWDVSTNRRWMNLLAPVLRPAFRLPDHHDRPLPALPVGRQVADEALIAAAVSEADLFVLAFQEGAEADVLFDLRRQHLRDHLGREDLV